ncbi:DNA polymerase III subunit delta [Mycoplasmatota bacterium]|nr:DNA polymerase III subunit delta [Mycoplasmatota bacterium]
MENIHLIIGEDKYRIEKKLKELIKAFGVDEFNVVTYDIEETSLSEALTDAQTVPFMSSKKVVIIKNIDFKSKEEFDEESFINYLKNPPTFCEFIIVPNKKLDNKTKLIKLLKEKSKVYEMSNLETEQLETAVVRYLEKRSIKIEKKALDELLVRTEHNTHKVMNEITKFGHYYAEGGIVTLSDVEELVSKNVEESVFTLTNAIVDRKKDLAMDIYYDLLRSEDPTRLVSLIINKFRELNYAKNLITKGYKKEDIQKFFNATPGRTYYIMKNAKGIGLEYIEEQLGHLSKLDYDIKRGAIDKKIGLELYLLRI